MWIFNLLTGFVVVIFAAGLEDNPYYLDNCGFDYTGNPRVTEGPGPIETYPWVGILLFPIDNLQVSSAVVLVTRQMAIGSASEIENYPKEHFRALSRVVLGTNSSGPRVRIREYTYHSEYGSETLSSLALLQLELDNVKFDILPICGPPSHFLNIRIYAVSLNEDSQYPVLTIHEMEHVNNDDCRRFYRRNGLDVTSMWPTRTTCARSTSGKECVWRGGAALATKLGGRWHLLGFGVNGPGCRAPSRFIDYGLYVSWVKRSVENIGNIAVTRLGPGHVILRRAMSSLQRFGRCDREEVIRELYTDQFRIVESDKGHKLRRVRYNITLYDELEYSCVIFEVFHNMKRPTPFLRLRRYCPDHTLLCYGFQFIQIDFYVEIDFVAPMSFKMAAYGRRPSVIDVKLAMAYYNKVRKYGYYYPVGDSWKKKLNDSEYLYWFRHTPNLIFKETLSLRAYRLNMARWYNRNQHIYNRTIVSKLYGIERREYFEFLDLHSLLNEDAFNYTRARGIITTTMVASYQRLQAIYGSWTRPGTGDTDRR